MVKSVLPIVKKVEREILEDFDNQNEVVQTDIMLKILRSMVRPG